jgi:GNAT superfamily N-acetyltransferase
LRGSRSLGGIAQSLSTELATAIASARSISRNTGIARLEVEAERAGARLAKTTLFGELARDVQRGRIYADKFAGLGLRGARKADDGKTPLVKLANAATMATDHRIGTIASSEASDAFNAGRAKYIRVATDVELLRVWHSERGKNTCQRCMQAHGTIVGVREPFPDGEPGSVHARCLCSWALIGTSERHGKRAKAPAASPPPAPSRNKVAVPAAPKAAKAPLPSAVRPRAEAAPAIRTRSAKQAAAAEARAAETARKRVEREAEKARRAADKALDKSIKAELKSAGIKTTGSPVETFRKLFKREPSPADVKAMFGADALNTVGKFSGEASFSPHFGISFRGATDNARVSISRSVVESGGKVTVKHDSLYLSQAVQGKGFGPAIIREQVAAYERIGVDRISLHSSEVGRYYWAKVGFDGPEALSSAKNFFRMWLERKGVNNAASIAAKPRTMRELASLQVGERRLGKEFLLSKDYGGADLSMNVKRGDPGFETLRKELRLP